MHLEKIINSAKENYNGDIRTAIAVHLYGEMVVFDCGNQIPAWAELEKINEIESQVNNELALQQLQGEKPKDKTPEGDTPEGEKVAETQVSIATESTGADEKEAEKVEEEQTEQTKFSDAELFEIVLSANKQNVTIGTAIVQKMYGDKGFDADGSFAGLVNIHKVAYVKGLITQLLNSEKVEEVEKVAEVQPTEEKPTDANTDEIKDELKAAEVETEKVETEAEKVENKE